MAKTVHPIIEELSDNMAMAFEQINLEYIDKMSKHIADIGKLTASDIHTLEQMNRMNANITSINKELAKQAKITEYRLQKVYQAAGLESYAKAAPFYYASGKKQVPFMKNKPMQKYIGSVNRLSKQTFENLSKTTVMSKSYKKAVDKAIYAVSSGVSDYNSYMRKTIRETVRDGLSVQYASTYKNKAGQIVHRTRRLDSAVRMNILDGVRSVQNGIRMIGGEQFGADGVEIDAHALCAEDHLEIQGQQFTMEEFEELQDDLERPIGELNCQHSYNPIVMGISVRTYSDEDLAELKAYSNEIIDIDGKEMTRYQASQMMRNLETEMRYAREELLAAKNLGSEGLQIRAERKMRRINKKYDDVCKKANLRPRRDKMFITKTDDAARLLETRYSSLAKQLDEELAAYRAWVEEQTKRISTKFVKASKQVEDVGKAEEVITINEKLLKQPTMRNYQKHLQENREKHLADWERRKISQEEIIERINPAMQKVVDEGVPSMRVDSEILEKIFKDGKFKNQLETGTSGGYLGADTRIRVSKNMFGWEWETGVVEKDLELYGYLGSKDVYTDIMFGDTSHYGDTIIHFKKEVRDRTTLTFGDSLTEADFGMLVPTDINEVDMTTAVAGRKRDMVYYADDVLDDGLEDIVLGAEEYTEYLELQYHGGLTLDDIESIHMKDKYWNSLSDDTKKYLKDECSKRGIKLDIIKEHY